MKRYLYGAVVAMAVVSMTGSALANESASPSRDRMRVERQELERERKDEQKKFQEQQKEQRTGFIQSMKNRWTEYRKQNTLRWWEGATKRLGKLIDREQAVANRIQERIVKLKEAGRDVSVLQADLEIAKAKIVLARQSLDEAISKMPTILAGADAKENVQAARELHRDVLEKIKAAHTALVQVLAATRGLSVTPTPTN